MDPAEVWKFFVGSPVVAVMYVWIQTLRADLKESRVREQMYVDMVIKIQSDRVTEANGRKA